MFNLFHASANTYFIIYVILLILATIVFRYASGGLSLNNINPISFFYYYIFTFFMIGIGLRLLGIYSIKMTLFGCPLNEQEMNGVSLFIGGWFFCVSIMFYCFSRLFPVNKGYRFSDVSYQHGGFSSIVMGTVCLCIVAFFCVVYIGIVFGGYPILDLFTAGGFEARLSRARFRTDFDGIAHIKNVIAPMGATIAAGMSLVLFKTAKKSLNIRLLLLSAWSLYAFTCLMRGSKGPIMWVIVYYVIISILLGKSYTIKSVVLCVVITASLAVITWVYLGRAI